MPPAPQTAKLISTLHLLIPRLRLLQKKSTASSVVQRRELAQLLENHRDASARIRVENVIATDIAVEVMEMVELYCELLLARAGVLDGLAFGEAGQKMRGRVREEMGRQTKGAGAGAGADGGKKKERGGTGGGWGFFGVFGGSTKQSSQQLQTTATSTTTTTSTTPAQNQYQEPDSGAVGVAATLEEGTDAAETYYLDAALDEASIAIFYAWSRFPTEVRELTLLRSLLTDRYGKDFMSLASENKLAGVKVPERLVKGLRVRPPSKELAESYLREIARAYKVPWRREDQEAEANPQFVDDDVSGDLGDLEDEHGGVGEVVRRASETAELTRATPPRGFNAHSSPVSVAPPGPRSDNPNPRVKVPDEKGKSGDEISTPSPSPGAQRVRTTAGNKSGIPDVDELSRRFAALKR
ncbi:regulator of Vps4 activity in the MVB pathway-domain-containing protein [Aspergillus fruticulosus]